MLRAQESSPSLNPTLAFPATNRESGTLAEAGLCQTPTLSGRVFLKWLLWRNLEVVCIERGLSGY